MKEYKKFFPYAVTLALTYFGFLCLNIPYFVAGGVTISGYSSLSLWIFGFGWSGILVSLLQIFEVLVMVGILMYSALGIFLLVLAKAKGKEAPQFLSKLMLLLLLVNLSLDFLVLTLGIIMVIVTKNEWMNTVGLSAGLFLKIMFDAGALVGLILGSHFMGRQHANGEETKTVDTEQNDDK
ncbi:MAG: hypothetical protein FWE84_02735 [Firmicutes bacterium]|nr:hypothetical protein [Bacillota bacterium]